MVWSDGSGNLQFLIESNFLRQPNLLLLFDHYNHYFMLLVSDKFRLLPGANKRGMKKSLSAYLNSSKWIKIIFTQVVDFTQLYLGVLFVLVLCLTQSHPQRFNYNFGVH